jgi:serralysin
MKKCVVLSALGICAIASPVLADSHQWVVNELFSTADGTVQFIELLNPTSAANETALNGKWVLSVSLSNQFNFPGDLPVGSTAHKSLLLGTQAFADLPGAPAPDYIVPEGFFDINGDTLKYWIYVLGDMTFGMGELPTDGVTSLNEDGTTGVNSPTNFAGQTGSVDASAGGVPTASVWGRMVMTAVLLSVGAVVIARRRATAVAAG